MINEIVVATKNAMRVYLAGPITGLKYNGTVEWRLVAQEELKKSGIIGVSPMRGKEYLASLKNAISGTGEEYAHFSVMSTPRGVTTRDRYDCTRCDAILVNLLGAERISIGTVMEIAWADLKRIPIICVIEDKGNLHEHMMITESIGFRVSSLEEALHITKCILL